MYTLQDIARLSKEQKFSLWYEPETKTYWIDNDAPESATWIYDVEQEETEAFIEDITNRVINEVQNGEY